MNEEFVGLPKLDVQCGGVRCIREDVRESRGAESREKMKNEVRVLTVEELRTRVLYTICIGDHNPNIYTS